MALVAFILSLTIALVGGVGVIAPTVVAALMAALHGPLGLVLVASLRLVLGTTLFIAAPASRAPLVFRALGVVTFATGMFTPLIGVERFDNLLAWWTTQDSPLVRTWAFCTASFGALVAYGIIPRDAR